MRHGDRRPIAVWIGCATLGLAGCETTARGPETLAVEGVPQLTHDGDVYVAGAPTRDGLAALKARGVETVIDLRLAEQVKEDEAGAARELGMKYVHIPMQSDGMTGEQVDAFLEAMRSRGDGPVLVHCASANRAGAMYGLWLGKGRGMKPEDAVRLGRQAGLRNEHLAEDLQSCLANGNTKPAE